MSVGLSGFADDGGGKAGVEPRRLSGKFSSIGERQEGSKMPLTGELVNPSRLIPELLSCSSSSGGGVGVRGGAGIGRLDAIAATFVDLRE